MGFEVFLSMFNVSHNPFIRQVYLLMRIQTINIYSSNSVTSGVGVDSTILYLYALLSYLVYSNLAGLHFRLLPTYTLSTVL